ncbi:MAG: dipicolinate synthase subunit B [Bacillota bacterium]|nr:dipicolinate synthase subunit B [Bacillota bacterium]
MSAADLKDVKVGFGVTGSHCTLKRVFTQMEVLAKEHGADLFPIFSPSIETSENRFGNSAKWRSFVQEFCDRPVIASIEEAEPIGPKKLLDVMVIAPCSGNTLAKLALGIVDSPVLMAAKAHLRNGRPLVLAVSTNDGLGMNGKNIGILLNTTNIYWVPFGQDDPWSKANSLVAKMDMLPKTISLALKNKQIQPILIEY